MFVDCERDGLNYFTTNLNHKRLYYQGDHENNEEEIVVAEVLKNVVFFFFKFSSIDLIENLHHHKSLEYQSVVMEFLSGIIKFRCLFQYILVLLPVGNIVPRVVQICSIVGIEFGALGLVIKLETSCLIVLDEWAVEE